MSNYTVKLIICTVTALIPIQAFAVEDSAKALAVENSAKTGNSIKRSSDLKFLIGTWVSTDRVCILRKHGF